MTYKADQEIYQCDRVDLALTPEGDLAILSFPIGDGSKSLNVGLTRELAENVHHQLRLLLSVSVIQPPIGVGGFVRMNDVSAVDAGPTEKPGTIVLSLTLEDGSVHHFRLPRELSAALRPRMRSAEAALPLKVERQ